MSHKPEFNLTNEQLEEMKKIITEFFSKELEQEIGNLQTDFVIDLINQKIGKYYYNAGVMDTLRLIKERADDAIILIKE